MKKTLALLIITTIFMACSKEDKSSEQHYELTTLSYLINNQFYEIHYSLDDNGNLTSIEDETSIFVDNYIDSNPSLIFHDINDYTIGLFKDDNELENFLESKNIPLLKDSKIEKSSLYSCENLTMYNDSYYNGVSFIWSSDSNGQLIGGRNSCLGQGSYWKNGTNEDRLKDFSNNTVWSYRCNSVPLCGFDGVVRPNDKVSSLYVRNVFARFYEHSNYGGRSITRDARSSGSSSYSRLKSVRYRGRWDDRISSVKLSY